jgi:hypothetical protein
MPFPENLDVAILSDPTNAIITSDGINIRIVPANIRIYLFLFLIDIFFKPIH